MTDSVIIAGPPAAIHLSKVSSFGVFVPRIISFFVCTED